MNMRNSNSNSDFAQKVKKLIERGRTVSCMESFTCGLFAASLGEVSGLSSVFVGGNVTYSNFAKECCGVKKELLEKYTAVSKEVCEDMALSSLKFYRTEYAVSFTGNAGPNPSEGKPVGLYYIGFAKNCGDSYKTEVREFYTPDKSRDEIRQEAVIFALTHLIEFMEE